MTPKELRTRWRGAFRYLRRVIEAMPEEQLSLKPADGVKTFASQGAHIVTWLRTHSRFVTGETLEKASAKTRDEQLAALDDLAARLDAYLATVTPEDLAEEVKVFYGKRSRASVLATMENHLAHHRGQMVTYLRVAGVEPPGYVGW